VLARFSIQAVFRELSRSLRRYGQKEHIMGQKTLIGALALGSVWSCGQEVGQEGHTHALQSEREASITQIASYALGRTIAGSILGEGFEVDDPMLARGISDAVRGREPLFNQEQMEEGLAAFQEQTRKKAGAEEATWNLEQATAYLAEIEQLEGIHTTDSGLGYKILQPGDGPSPSRTDTVRVHYVGMLLDGVDFDSSYRRGVPSVFAVGDVIDGWTEALQLMQVGARWRLFIPPHLAYGEEGTGPIGPNALTIFDIELLGIESGAQ